MEMIEVVKHIHGSRTCGRRQDLHLPTKVSDPVNGRNKYSKIFGKQVVKLPFKCSLPSGPQEKTAAVGEHHAGCRRCRWADPDT